EWSGERCSATGGFLRKRAAWQMSKVWRARVRVRNELLVRKFSRSEIGVRLSSRQSDLAATDRSRANDKTAQHRQDRFDPALHFPQRQAVQSISSADRQERCRLRI